MYSDSDVLEIKLHLNDGRIVTFTQPDDSVAESLMDGTTVQQVFGRKILLLRGEDSISLFPTHKIARFDVNRLMGSWSDSLDLIQADQIADYDFQWLRETLSAVQRQFPESRRIDNYILAADLELANSEHLYLRVEFRGAEAGERPQELFVDRMLDSGDILIRLREGGYSVINPKSIVRLTLYPILDYGETRLKNKTAV